MHSALNTKAFPAFMQKQHEFTARIRDPQHAQAPVDIEPRRMKVYEELFYNNIEEFLANAFPVLRSIHDDDKWYALVRDYFATHQAHTPLFHEMPIEFLHYLENERVEQEEDYPFMLELAHYEWLELELFTAEEATPHYNSEGNLLNDIPAVSPLIRLARCHYAVHHIGPDYIPGKTDAQPTHLLVYRDLHDEVGFIELNAVTARLVALLLQDSDLGGQQLLLQIAQEIEHPNPQTVIDGGTEILYDLKQRGIILGTKITKGAEQ